MHLTVYTDYTLPVMMYLALKYPDGGVATIDEIAGAYGISRNHLTKIIHELSQVGLIETTRGRAGGTRLAQLGHLNVLFYAWVLQGRADLALRSADAAVGLLVTLVTIIAGRVTPMFTANAVPGYAFRRWSAIKALAVPLPLLAFAYNALGASAWLVGSAAGATAVVHGIRLAEWRSWQVGRRPILAILHAAYAWVPLSFAPLALSALGFVPHSIALHALAVGLLGGGIIAMITRTALGHTSRRLVAGSTYCLLLPRDRRRYSARFRPVARE